MLDYKFRQVIDNFKVAPLDPDTIAAMEFRGFRGIVRSRSQSSIPLLDYIHPLI
jgi:hypothetical protein